MRKLILHDLTEQEAAAYLPPASETITQFAAQPTVRNCIGCFGCWTKTPGICVLPDRGREYGAMIPKHDVHIIVSRCVYGGLSPDVKAVLDRNIGISLPFFRIVGGEMHHYPRYKHNPSLEYHFYGPDISEGERDTARKLIAANALNLYAPKHDVFFYSALSEVREALA